MIPGDNRKRHRIQIGGRGNLGSETRQPLDLFRKFGTLHCCSQSNVQPVVCLPAGESTCRDSNVRHECPPSFACDACESSVIYETSLPWPRSQTGRNAPRLAVTRESKQVNMDYFPLLKLRWVRCTSQTCATILKCASLEANLAYDPGRAR